MTESPQIRTEVDGRVVKIVVDNAMGLSSPRAGSHL